MKVFLASKCALLQGYLLVMVVATFARAMWALLVPIIPLSDGVAYEIFAQNILEHGTYGWKAEAPSAFWPPGTSFVYAAVFGIFGDTYIPIVVLNVGLGVFIVLSTMVVSEHWFGRKAALAGGMLLALWPGLIQFTTVLASELIFIALVQAALLILVVWKKKKSVKDISIGITLGAASYVKSIALLLPLVFCFAMILEGAKPVKVALSAVIMISIMAAMVAPWTIRNTNEFGEIVVLSANGGANLWMGNNPKSVGRYMSVPSDTYGLNEVARDKLLRERAIQYILEEPAAFLIRSLRKLVILHEAETIGVVWNEKGLENRFGRSVVFPLKVLSTSYWWICLILASIGVLTLIKRWGVIRVIACPLLLLWIYYAAIHAIIVAQDRYHFTSIPMIAAFASVGLLKLQRWYYDLRYKPLE